MDQESPHVAPVIRRLMSNASESQVIEASENLRAYLKLLYGIFLRREAEAQAADSATPGSDARVEFDGAPPSTV